VPIDTQQIAAGVRAKAIYMAKDGMTAKEISDALNVNLSVIKVWVERPPRGNTTRQEIIALRDAGLADVEIARQLGVTKQNLTYHAGPRRRLKPPTEVYVTIGLREATVAKCKEIAASFGLYGEKGPNCKEPSIAFMLEKIADGDLMVVKTRMFDPAFMLPKDKEPSPDP
jgi:orotate phosphoribosyltransferase-like protein